MQKPEQQQATADVPETSLKSKFKQMLKKKKDARTNEQNRIARTNLSKEQRQAIRKETNKQGAKALIKKLGLTDDRETREQVEKLLASGKVSDASSLLAKLDEQKKEAQKKKEMKKWVAEGLDDDVLNLDPEKMAVNQLPQFSSGQISNLKNQIQQLTQT